MALSGRPTGLSVSPSWMAEGNSNLSNFGKDISCAGDVNKDGYSDIIIGAYGYDQGSSSFDNGRAYLYLGSQNGLQLLYDQNEFLL